MQYNTEEEFLKNYNPNEFERLSMTTDILLVSVSSRKQDNYRKTSKKMMSILLAKRNDYPYKDMWCLPGGFVNPKEETLEECAKRVLKKETNLSNIYLEQLYTFDDINRDPRMRVVSTSYIALVDKNRLDQKISDNASWFDIIFYDEDEDSISVTLDNGSVNFSIEISKKLRERTTDRYKFEEVKNDYLAFDHSIVIVSGIERLRNKINYTDIVFNMMPEYFTLGDLQQVYEVILNKKLLDPAFRRIIVDKVEKTDKVQTGEGHRPSALFKYRR